MKIMFDSGHGGTDPGAVANGLTEKALALQTAQAAGRLLMAKCAGQVDRDGRSVEVGQTRDDDITLTPAERLRRIAAFNPYICLSIHYNAATSAATGTEVFHSARDQRDDQLAQLLIARLKETGMPSRGIKTKTTSSGEDYYYIIREVMGADTIAVLIEGAFLTNTEDARKIKDGWINQAAEAIAQAVFDFIQPQLFLAPKESVFQGPAVVFDGRTYPAQIIDGTTWTPVRAVAEAAGLRVDYDAATKVTTLQRR